jgi:acetyl-CoA carboxylase biotin carboxyl carrier protein
MLTFEQIKELVQLVAAHRLSGLEVSVQGFQLRIAGQGTHSAGASFPAKETPGEWLPADPPPQPAAPAPTAPVATVPVASAPESALHVVTSPIVGTFYRAPSPEAPPFVEVGDRVRKGQVLCIVEAMKLMNEIESDVDGIVEKVHPQNAQPVEYGEPLFTIRTA